MTDKYAAIAADRGRFPVPLICAALVVSASGFYASQARQRRPSRADADERLRV